MLKERMKYPFDNHICEMMDDLHLAFGKCPFDNVDKIKELVFGLASALEDAQYLFYVERMSK